MTDEEESCDECRHRVRTTEEELLCCMPKSICFGKIVEPSHKCREYEPRSVRGTTIDSEVMKVAFNLYGEKKPKCAR